MQKEKLETLLRNEFADNKIYQETLKIAKKNSEDASGLLEVLYLEHWHIIYTGADSS